MFHLLIVDTATLLHLPVNVTFDKGQENQANMEHVYGSADQVIRDETKDTVLTVLQRNVESLNISIYPPPFCTGSLQRNGVTGHSTSSLIKVKRTRHSVWDVIGVDGCWITIS